jgi:magnesium chelatase family protein
MRIFTSDRSIPAPTYFARSDDKSSGAQAQLTAHPGREIGAPVVYTLAVSAHAHGSIDYDLPGDMDEDERATLMSQALDVALDAEARIQDLVVAFVGGRREGGSMVVKTTSATLRGIESIPFEIDITQTGSFPSFDIVGLPEHSARESRVRIRSAIRASGFEMQNKRVVIQMAGDDHKEGPATDLAVALGLLAMNGHLPGVDLSKLLILGELSLSGNVLPVRGAICHAETASKASKTVICSASNADEAWGMTKHVIAGRTLRELVQNILQESPFVSREPADVLLGRGRMPCWSDVRGQEKAKMALEVAVAGGFRVLLNGPPGCGKTMLARRLPGIMPNMPAWESVESTKIASVAGLLPRGVAMLTERPFRAPHHTGSTVSLVGGGARPRLGELSLAHNGVLYLDELPEFSRSSIEAIAIPLDDGYISVCRNRSVTTFPAKTMLVAAANPCPCGFSGSTLHGCSCRDGAKKQYSKRRADFAKALGIDLTIELEAQSPRDLKDQAAGETSEVVRRRVTRSQKMQRERYGCLISGTDTPLAEAVAVVLATLDGRATVKNSDLVYGSMLFGLTDNQDALEGRQ